MVEKDLDIRKLCYCLFVAAAELDTGQTLHRVRNGKIKRTLIWEFPSGVTLRLETPADDPLITKLIHQSAEETRKALLKDFTFDYAVAQDGTGEPNSS